MDPTACLRIMRDPTEPLDDRADAADALLAWITAGGFVPAGEDRNIVLAQAAQFRPIAPDEHLEATYDDATSGEVEP